AHPPFWGSSTPPRATTRRRPDGPSASTSSRVGAGSGPASSTSPWVRLPGASRWIWSAEASTTGTPASRARLRISASSGRRSPARRWSRTRRRRLARSASRTGWNPTMGSASTPRSIAVLARARLEAERRQAREQAIGLGDVGVVLDLELEVGNQLAQRGRRLLLAVAAQPERPLDQGIGVEGHV